MQTSKINLSFFITMTNTLLSYTTDNHVDINAVKILQTVAVI